MRQVLLGVLLCLIAGATVAETASLAAKSMAGASRGALIARNLAAEPAVQNASLFVGQQPSGLFAPAPRRAAVLRGAHASGLSAAQIDRLRGVIGQAESRRDGYDAVQHGARIRPSKPPTRMTLAEIYRWIDDTPGQPHAIGRFQFIPTTLRRLVRHLDIPLGAQFTPQLQDQLADQLLKEAGLHALARGELGRQSFMNNLAKIWAGLPNSSGKSHYHGYAGNRAAMTWAKFDAHMREIFPG